MADTLMTTGRTTGFSLLYPRTSLHVRDLTLGATFTTAYRDAIREGMWFFEQKTASDPAGGRYLNMIAGTGNHPVEGTMPLTLGIPRCVFADGDRSDIKWAGKAPVIYGPSGWDARYDSTLFVSSGIDEGDLVTCYTGTALSGSVGKVIVAAAEDCVIGRCVAKAADASWIEVVHMDPHWLTF